MVDKDDFFYDQPLSKIKSKATIALPPAPKGSLSNGLLSILKMKNSHTMKIQPEEKQEEISSFRSDKEMEDDMKPHRHSFESKAEDF